jgi:hypothetical protein
MIQDEVHRLQDEHPQLKGKPLQHSQLQSKRPKLHGEHPELQGKLPQLYCVTTQLQR